jgi:mono/diheme cytochrome c family protein
MRSRIWLASLVLLLAGSLAGAKVPKKRGSDYEEGKKIWKRSCWQCHGAKAEGDGPAAGAVAGGVPTLRGGVVVKDKRNDLIRSVLNGKGLMPAFSAEMERPDAKRVLIFLEKLDERDGVDPEEEEEAPNPSEEEEEEEAGEGNAPSPDVESEPEVPTP